MSLYQLTSGSTILRLSDGASIPMDEGNGDYRDYLAWLAAGNTPLPAPTADPAEVLAQKKAQRERAVAAIVVTTQAGHTFDGDEVSQGRMARAILGLQSQLASTTTAWVLADNSVIQVGSIELTEALTLAGTRQTELWVIT
jgi:hypothetical protein